MLNLKQEFKGVENAENGADVHIINPATGLPSGLVISVVGAESGTYKTAQHTEYSKRLKRKGMTASPEEMENSGNKILAACTTGWSGTEIITQDGESIPFSTTNAEAVYKISPDISHQVAAFIEDKSNFLPKQDDV